MTVEQLICVIHGGVAALMAGLGYPLWRNLVPPNRWYGFRTPATLRDERIWYPVNQATGGWLLLTGAVTLPVVVGTYLLGLQVNAMVPVNLIPLMTGLLATTVYGFVLVSRLKQRYGADAGRID